MIRRPPRSPLFPYTPPSRSLLAGTVAGRLDGADDRLHRLRVRFQVGGPASLVTASAAQAARPQEVAQGVEDLRAHPRSEEHTSELQSRLHLVCRLLLEKKKK